PTPQGVRVYNPPRPLAGRDDLAGERRTDVDDPTDWRVDLRVGQPHIGLGALRGGGRLLFLTGMQLIASNRDLLGVRPRQGKGRARGVDLLRGRSKTVLAHFV